MEYLSCVEFDGIGKLAIIVSPLVAAKLIRKYIVFVICSLKILYVV